MVYDHRLQHFFYLAAMQVTGYYLALRVYQVVGRYRLHTIRCSRR